MFLFVCVWPVCLGLWDFGTVGLKVVGFQDRIME